MTGLRDGSVCPFVFIVISGAMNNYQEETLKELLKDVKVRCSRCHSKMIRVIDLYDDTLIGYSCENCPHYNLLDNNPV